MVAIFKIIISATLLASASAAAIKRVDASLLSLKVSDPVLAIPTLDNTDILNETDALDMNKRATAASSFGVLKVDEPVLANPPVKTQSSSSSSTALPTGISATGTFGKLIVGGPVLATRATSVITKALA